MNNIKAELLGVGSVKITIGNRNVYIDAFNSINSSPELKDGDIIVFTHCDADHFDVTSIPDIRESDVLIIGPPSISRQILLSEKAEISRIKELNSPDNANPDQLDLDFMCIKAFSTSHFMAWNPIHNSYLLEISGIKIYITGDSMLTAGLKQYLNHVDYVICNLVHEGFITKRQDPRFAVHHHLSYLLDIIDLYNPVKIICSHLINFSGTVEPEEMSELVDRYGFNDRIIVPDKEREEPEILSI